VLGVPLGVGALELDRHHPAPLAGGELEEPGQQRGVVSGGSERAGELHQVPTGAAVRDHPVQPRRGEVLVSVVEGEERARVLAIGFDRVKH
jgi:hypothetical protein